MSLTESMTEELSLKTGNMESFDFLLEFLTNLRDFINSSKNPDISVINEGMKAITFDGSTSKADIPSHTLWTCFNKVGMANKIMNYIKLILIVLVNEIQNNKEDFQRLTEWQHKFTQLRDSVFVFSLEAEYTSGLIVVIKNFVMDLLKEIRKVDMQDYPNKIFAYNFYEYMISEFLSHHKFTSIIMKEILQSSADIVKQLRTYKFPTHSSEIVNCVEGLNRHFNIIQNSILMDIQKMRRLNPEIFASLRLIFKELGRIDHLPKYFSKRVVKLLEMVRWN